MGEDLLEQAISAMNTELDVAEDIILMRWREHVQSTSLGSHKVFKPSIIKKGGAGSGNFGHSGRPGKVGGSGPGSGGVLDTAKPAELPDWADGWGKSVLEEHYDDAGAVNERFELMHIVNVMRGDAEYAYTDSTLRGKVHRDTKTIELTSIHVDKLLRRQGIATALIQEVANHYPGFALSTTGVYSDDGKALAAKLQLSAHKEEIVEKQLPINDASKKALIQIRMEMFNDASDTLAEQVFNGEITIGQWQESMKALIKGAHTSTAAIGKGGWDLMGPRDWGRIGTPVRNQYKFLANFAATLDEKRDTVTLRYIQNRARLYGEGIVQSAVMAEAGFWFGDHLPWLPRDGSTECLMRCHCKWVMTIVEARKTYNVVEARWELGEADHCTTCVKRNGHIEVIKTPLDVNVPSQIGGY